MDVVFLYHSRKDLLIQKGKLVERTILFANDDTCLKHIISMKLTNYVYLTKQSNKFAQFVTKMGFYCDILTYDPLLQRQVSSESRTRLGLRV